MQLEKIGEHFKGRHVLITGGLGFIGSNLAIKLVDLGADVTILDSLIPEYGGNLANIEPVKDKVSVNISDVRDHHSMKYIIQGKDFLFNLAGQTSHMDSMANPKVDLEINAEAQLSILEACRQFNQNVKITFASTRQIYGKPEYLPVDEKHPVRPVDVNGINKNAGEQYHILYNNVYGIKACALRLTNTYGPRMRVKDARQTFVGIWIRLILEGNEFEVWNGSQLRDFNYIDDCLSALLLSAVSPESTGKIYNLGSDEVVSLKDLADILIKANGGEGGFKTMEFPSERKKIDIGDYYSDYSLIRNELGWKPEVSLTEGLGNTLDYYREQLNSYL